MLTTEEHLNKIVARCRTLLALAEKRTPGRWGNETPSYRAYAMSGRHCVAEMMTHTSHQRDSDAAYIVACAGAAEAGWKATIAAIEGRLEEREQSWTNWELTAQISSFDAGLKSDYPFHKSLNAYIDAWPEALL